MHLTAPAASLPRRAFLQSAVAASSGLLFGGLTVPAADPIVRTGRPYFKLSLAAYSFNRMLERNWPKPSGKAAAMTLLDFIDYCAELDVPGTELTSYYFPQEITPEYLLQVRERAFRLGLDISGTAIGNNFCVPAGPEREQQLADCRRWVDVAAELGAPVIRIFAGNVPTGDSEEQALARCVSAINESVAYAATRGVILALENHGGITATPQQLLKIVEQVSPSPWFGVNFDSGNFRTDDPYRDLALIAPYAVNAQVKVSIAPAGEPKQPADFKRIVQILSDAGYRGYLVLEYEEAEDPKIAIPRYLDELRALIS